MAIKVDNTNYNGEVLERILTVATTSNELVEKGLIHVIPGVEKKISIPRLKVGRMLQKRKENPVVEDSKGDFNWSEQTLEPHDFMAFTLFNPRAFEQIWRKWQPKGNLVFAQLPPEAQNALLDALSKQVQFELGDHYVNGEYVEDGGDDKLMNGILTQAAKAADYKCVDVSKADTILKKLKAVRTAIPKAMRSNPSLRIIMSVEDFDKYDDELTEREAKNASETEVNRKRYKGITVETVAACYRRPHRRHALLSGCRRQLLCRRQPPERRKRHSDRQVCPGLRTVLLQAAHEGRYQHRLRRRIHRGRLPRRSQVHPKGGSRRRISDGAVEISRTALHRDTRGARGDGRRHQALAHLPGVVRRQGVEAGRLYRHHPP